MAMSVIAKEATHPVRSPGSMETSATLPGTEGTTFAPTLRGVRAIRLSVMTDETTSPERQREADDKAAAELGISFGEGDALREAVDLGVSASKTTPFERPELGAWMRRPDEFDAIVWWRFDRAVRSMEHMNALAVWARAHRKMLVFAEGPGGSRLVLDFRNPLDPIASLMATLFAFAAQMEAQAIMERVTGAQAAMRTMPLRWRGARPPYGYMPAPLEGGGWTLVQDPDAVKVLERIIKDLLIGKKSRAEIARTLNAEGVPTPRDSWAKKKERETGGKAGAPKGQRSAVHKAFKWTSTVITMVLSTYALLGWKTHNGQPVRDAEGRPVMATADPILTRGEFDLVAARLDETARAPKERKDSNALLLRVIHCHSCGGRMYLQPRTKGRRANYRCQSKSQATRCDSPTAVRADWVDEYVNEQFLALVGSVKVTEVRVIPGYDPAPEIASTAAEFAEHQEQKGRQKSKAAQREWQRRADALDARLAELEDREKVDERREVIDTGQTFATRWATVDVVEKRRMLISAGARLEVSRGDQGRRNSLDLSRLDFTVTGGDLGGVIEELHAIRADEAEPVAA